MSTVPPQDLQTLSPMTLSSASPTVRQSNSSISSSHFGKQARYASYVRLRRSPNSRVRKLSGSLPLGIGGRSAP